MSGDEPASGGVFEKVAVFVLRRARAGVELLTFLHPTGGRQVPAGSVEPGEAPVRAARREVREETGIVTPPDLALLGETVAELDGEAIAVRALALADEAGRIVDRIPRGHRVRMLGAAGGETRVARLLFDHGVAPPRVLLGPAGRAARPDLAIRLRRSVFAALVADDGRRAWTHAADGHALRVSWEPLESAPALVPEQASWLAAHARALARIGAGG